MKTALAVLIALLAVPLQAADVEGFVWTIDGTPLPAATVAARIPQGTAILATATVEDGTFRLTGLPHSVIDVEVRADGFAPVTARTVTGDLPLDLVLRRGESVPRGEPETPAQPPHGDRSIRGTVRIGDQPLAGAPVMITLFGEESFVRTVVTDAKGRFEATGLPAYRAVVDIGEGLAPRWRSNVQLRSDRDLIDLEHERTAVADIVLTASPIVSGRVVDADDKPVGGAQVQILLAGRSSLDFANEPVTRTRADGRYRIAAPPFEPTEHAVVAISSRNRATIRSKPFAIGGSNTTVDVQLPRFDRITLRVLGSGDQPLARATVAFAATEETHASGEPRMLLLPPFASRQARTNDAGEVVLELVPDTYDFAAAAAGYQQGAIRAREIGRATTIDLALEPAVALRGRVHRNDTGVAGVHVAVVGHQRMLRDWSTTTAADGTFALEGLGRGTYRLSVLKQDELIQRTLEVEAPGDVDVALPPAGVLQARVLDAATREPVREFVSIIEPLEQDEESARRGLPQLQRGEKSSDGTFTATLSIGAYRVSAGAVGYTSSTPVEVRLGEDRPAEITIALERGITITGRVLGEDGMPVEGAEVYAFGAELDRMRRRSAPRVAPPSTRSAEDGAYTITGIEPGAVTMTVRKQGFVPFRKAIDVQSLLTLDVQLTRGLSLEGIVLRGGKPVADANVTATTAAVGGDAQSAATDRNGRFVLHGLTEARYTVAAYSEDAHTEARDIDPTQKKELVLSLDPRPTGVLYGTVNGIANGLTGKIVRRGVFVQTDDGGAEGLIDDAGNYRIENAPVGTLYVTAMVETPHGGRTSSRRQVELSPGQALRVDLDLGGGARVHGRVTLDGKPLGGARLFFAHESGVTASAVSREDGVYDVTLAMPGVYEVSAHAEAAMRSFQTTREFRGGETFDVDLREQVLEGIVLDAGTRQPLAGALVTLAPEAASQTITGETMTDANGRFRLIAGATGAHRLFAAAGGYAQRAQSVLLGNARPPSFSFELQRTTPLRVRVIDSRFGTPLDAHVVVTTKEGGYVPVRAERTPDGETYLFSLAPGTYRVTAIVAGYAAKSVDVTAPGSIDIAM